MARFCAPWVPNAGEEEKNALPRARKAFGPRRFGRRGRSWEPVKAFFSFSPGNCLRCKKRAKAHTPRRAAIPGFLIDVPPRRSWRGRLLRLSAFICGYKRRGAEAPHAAVMHRRGLGDRRGVAERRIGQARGPAPTVLGPASANPVGAGPRARPGQSARGRPRPTAGLLHGLRLSSLCLGRPTGSPLVRLRACMVRGVKVPSGHALSGL